MQRPSKKRMRVTSTQSHGVTTPTRGRSTSLSSAWGRNTSQLCASGSASLSPDRGHSTLQRGGSTRRLPARGTSTLPLPPYVTRLHGLIVRLILKYLATQSRLKLTSILYVAVVTTPLLPTSISWKDQRRARIRRRIKEELKEEKEEPLTFVFFYILFLKLTFEWRRQSHLSPLPLVSNFFFLLLKMDFKEEISSYSSHHCRRWSCLLLKLTSTPTIVFLFLLSLKFISWRRPRVRRTRWMNKRRRRRRRWSNLALPCYNANSSVPRYFASSSGWLLCM